MTQGTTVRTVEHNRAAAVLSCSKLVVLRVCAADRLPAAITGVGRRCRLLAPVGAFDMALGFRRAHRALCEFQEVPKSRWSRKDATSEAMIPSE